MKCDIFLMILNSKKHEGQVPEMELALLFQISLLLYTSIQVSQVRELIEVKEVITPYGRSGSEETVVPVPIPFSLQARMPGVRERRNGNS